jgi:hypothetical protein
MRRCSACSSKNIRVHTNMAEHNRRMKDGSRWDPNPASTQGRDFLIWLSGLNAIATLLAQVQGFPAASIPGRRFAGLPAPSDTRRLAPSGVYPGGLFVDWPKEPGRVVARVKGCRKM